MEKMLYDLLMTGTSVQQDIYDCMDSISKLPFNSVDFPYLWDGIDTISKMFEGAGFSLAAFFFMLGFMKKTMMFELVTMENVVKCLLRLIIAKVIIDNSLFIVEQFALIMNDLVAMVPDLPRVIDEAAREAQVQAIVNEISELGLFDRLMRVILYIPVCFILLAAKFVIFLQLWGRFLQICLYAVISPLPLSTVVAEETSGVARKYVQSYIAVLLQGLLILLILYLYILFMQNESLTHGMEWIHVQLLVSVILIFMLSKSGNWAKQIMGL